MFDSVVCIGAGQRADLTPVSAALAAGSLSVRKRRLARKKVDELRQEWITNGVMHPYRRCTYCIVNVQSEDLRNGFVALALRVRKRWRVRECWHG